MSLLAQVCLAMALTKRKCRAGKYVMAFYRGYNTVNSIFKPVRIVDNELVRQDIINHFNTNQGEAVMRPNFGSTVKSIAFEPLTPESQETLITEVKRVVALDPRVVLTELQIEDFENGLQVALTLDYVNADLSEQMFIRFDRDTQSAVFA